MDELDEEELDSGSLHVSDLNDSDISKLHLSAISNDPEDEHEFPEAIDELNLGLEEAAFEPPEDTMQDTSFRNKTDNESFQTISKFPLSQSNIPDTSSLHLSDLNSSIDSTKDESLFAGGKKRRKTKKRTKTKKGGKSKKIRKNKVTKKLKKTKMKRKRSAKLRQKKRLRGGFIGDNGIDMESYGGTNPYSVVRDSDPRF